MRHEIDVGPHLLPLIGAGLKKGTQPRRLASPLLPADGFVHIQPGLLHFPDQFGAQAHKLARRSGIVGQAPANDLHPQALRQWLAQQPALAFLGQLVPWHRNDNGALVTLTPQRRHLLDGSPIDLLRLPDTGGDGHQARGRRGCVQQRRDGRQGAPQAFLEGQRLEGLAGFLGLAALRQMRLVCRICAAPGGGIVQERAQFAAQA